MRRFSMNIVGLAVVLAFVAMGVSLHGVGPQGETLEYKVLSIDPGTWVVTAQEVETGNEVKFRMPPTMFKGKTFDANLEAVNRGQRFMVRGPRNVRLDQLIVENPLPQTSQGPRAQRMRPGKMAKLGMQFPKPLGWEIVNVNPQQWVVTARNRTTQRVIKFKVNPEGFNGFRFRANLRGISKGKGFSLVAPNEAPFSNMCTLLE